MRGKTLRITGFTILVAAILIGALFMKYKDHILTTPVVVSVTNISANAEITPDTVKVIELPQIAVPPKTVRSLDEIEGKWVANGRDIPKNGFLFYEQLVDEENMLSRSMQNANQDESLVSIPVDLTRGLGGKITQGDHIELWFVTRGNKPLYAGKLLSGVEVVSIQDAQGKSITTEGAEVEIKETGNQLNILSSGGMPSGPGIPKLLTIKVPDSIVPHLLASQNRGSLVVVGKAQDENVQAEIGEAREWLHKQMNATDHSVAKIEEEEVK